MDDVSTSPDVAVDAAPAPTSGTESAAPAVESSPAPEEVQTTTTAENSAQETRGEIPTEKTPNVGSLSDFDADAWDGNIDLLPPELQVPVRHLHKNLEGGFTKKFQKLADDRKAFDTDRDAWSQDKKTWEDSKSELESERDMLKRILEGSEDPRIGELTTANEGLTASIQTIKDEYAAFQSMVDADIEEQAKEYADNFARQHANIFDDDAKRGEFEALLDSDWDPDVAVKLVGAGEKVVEMATKLKEGNANQELAVEHALLKVGESTGRSAPRPGAKLTAGAESKNNPASVSGQLETANPKEARSQAARAAMNWAREAGIRRS
jgi:hypothetical protein